MSKTKRSGREAKEEDAASVGTLILGGRRSNESDCARSPARGKDGLERGIAGAHRLSAVQAGDGHFLE